MGLERLDIILPRRYRGTAEENGRKAKGILGLYDEMKQTVPAVTRSQYAIAAVDALFKTPIFVPSEFYEAVDDPEEDGKPDPPATPGTGDHPPSLRREAGAVPRRMSSHA